MKVRMQLLRMPAYFLGALALSLMLTTNSYAAWYDVRILKISPRSASGDVVIQVAPGANETKFTTSPSRVTLLGSDKGTNRILSVILTAVTLNTEVSVSVANPPDWKNPQVVTSVGFVAP